MALLAIKHSLKIFCQKWRHIKAQSSFCKRATHWERTIFLQILKFTEQKKVKKKKKIEIVLNIKIFIPISFLTQNFYLKKTRELPF